MRMSLELVVAAIILLVIAVVIIAFFVNGIRPGVDMTDARNQCIVMATSSCQSFDIMPPTWSTPTVNDNGVMKSCQTITGIPNDCGRIGSSGGETAADEVTISTEAQCTAKGSNHYCKAACDASSSEVAVGMCGSDRQCCKNLVMG